MEREQPFKNSGTYTILPNVLFDTCDLPESAQILYMRLYRQYWYRGGRFTGSIRKLSNAVRLSKSTCDRMVKRLEQAKLITVTREPGETMTIELVIEDIWKLNKYHSEVESVPNWGTELPACPSLGQSVPEQDGPVQSGTDRPNEGQNVPGVSAKREGIKRKKSNEEERIEESFSSPLLEQMKRNQVNRPSIVELRARKARG